VERPTHAAAASTAQASRAVWQAGLECSKEVKINSSIMKTQSHRD
jgi:hypothetical protein